MFHQGHQFGVAGETGGANTFGGEDPCSAHPFPSECRAMTKVAPVQCPEGFVRDAFGGGHCIPWGTSYGEAAERGWVPTVYKNPSGGREGPTTSVVATDVPDQASSMAAAMGSVPWLWLAVGAGGLWFASRKGWI